MEPGFYRGDILFLYNGRKEISTGDIPVFNLPGRDIPIVHRILRLHEKSEASFDPEGARVDILTKGDNNYKDDRVLYDPGQLWIHEDNLLGRAGVPSLCGDGDDHHERLPRDQVPAHRVPGPAGRHEQGLSEGSVGWSARGGAKADGDNQNGRCACLARLKSDEMFMVLLVLLASPLFPSRLPAHLPPSSAPQVSTFGPWAS